MVGQRTQTADKALSEEVIVPSLNGRLQLGYSDDLGTDDQRHTE